MTSTAIVLPTLSAAKLAEVKTRFDRVYYHPDEIVPDEEAREAGFWFTSLGGLPANITSLDQIPKTRLVQLSSGEWKWWPAGS